MHEIVSDDAQGGEQLAGGDGKPYPCVAEGHRHKYERRDEEDESPEQGEPHRRGHALDTLEISDGRDVEYEAHDT